MLIRGCYGIAPSISLHKLLSFAGKVDLEQNRAAWRRGSNIPALRIRCPAEVQHIDPPTEVQLAPGGPTGQGPDLNLGGSALDGASYEGQTRTIRANIPVRAFARI